MRVSHRWLRELLPGLDLSPARVAERLTAAGLEVESITPFGAGLDPVLVAEVRALEPHPRRANLRLVTVDLGDRQERVVCGAPNVPDPGGLVVLAPLGAHLPAVGMTLTARDIGGVTSEGMLCSESELGIGAGSDGILILPLGSARPGDRFNEAFPASDTLYEIGVTPNRPDALGHVGVARELAALLGLPFTLPTFAAPKAWAAGDVASLIAVDNREPERCPHYAAAAVLDVTVAPSPLGLQWRLTSLGVRPVSNVVDVTNLLLMLYGQPLHAFDLDRVRGSRIVVRRATPGEPFVTLDGVARDLVDDDLMICDGEAPSALAGVMGGQHSEIRAETRRVLIECAYFAPRGVRRSSRRHGLHTESSHRFERGVDHGRVGHVLEHARAWLAELAGGSPVPGEVHARGALPAPHDIELRTARATALLGRDVTLSEATDTLTRLGFVEVARSADSVTVRSATWRPDVTREVDLIEEVARVRGLDAIPTVLPAIQPSAPRRTGLIERELVRAAQSLGLFEALTYSFVSARDLAAVRAPESVVTLDHPLSEERSVLRTSLLPGLLDALERARRNGERGARLFSVGARFLPVLRELPSGAVGDARPRRRDDIARLPEERLSFAAVLAGPRPTYLAAPTDLDVWDAKGVAVALVERVTGQAPAVAHWGDARPAHLHPRAAARLTVERTVVGSFGLLHPEVLDARGLEGQVLVVELDADALESLGRPTPRCAPIPRLPPVTRDIALTVHDDVTAGAVLEILRAAGGDLCESVELFDLFRGGAVPADHRSLAFHVVYRDPLATSAPERARTLTDREVDERHAQVVAAARERLGAELRA